MPVYCTVSGPTPAGGRRFATLGRKRPSGYYGAGGPILRGHLAAGAGSLHGSCQSVVWHGVQTEQSGGSSLCLHGQSYYKLVSGLEVCDAIAGGLWDPASSAIPELFG